MKLHSDTHSGLNSISGYGTDYVEINQKPYHHAVLVSPSGAILAWPVANFAALNASDFSLVCAQKPELFILGTGTRQYFPKPELLKPLIDARIGFEIMDSQAACRTYNILMGEGRQVLAAILLDLA